jgi:hypothetical protein
VEAYLAVPVGVVLGEGEWGEGRGGEGGEGGGVRIGRGRTKGEGGVRERKGRGRGLLVNGVEPYLAVLVGTVLGE